MVNDLELKKEASFQGAELAGIHPENFLRRFMNHLSMSNADMKAAIALANVAMPKVGLCVLARMVCVCGGFWGQAAS